MKVRFTRRNSSRGGAIVEMLLLTALIALVALPAVRVMGRNATKPMCAYLFGVDRGVTDVSTQWSSDGSRCRQGAFIVYW